MYCNALIDFYNNNNIVKQPQISASLALANKQKEKVINPFREEGENLFLSMNFVLCSVCNMCANCD